MEVNNMMFWMFIQKALPPRTVLEMVATGICGRSKDPSTSAQYLSFIYTDHRRMDNEVELHGRSINVAIIVHDQSFGTTMEQAPKYVENPWGTIIVTIIYAIAYTTLQELPPLPSCTP